MDISEAGCTLGVGADEHTSRDVKTPEAKTLATHLLLNKPRH